MLKSIQVDFKQLTDIDMIMCIERDIGGGISPYSKSYINFQQIRLLFQNLGTIENSYKRWNQKSEWIGNVLMPSFLLVWINWER